MSRIAILADIHGNPPALEAVIADIAKQSVDEVLVGGDLVGRGPQGRAVVDRIRELGWPSVRGNHEEYLLTFRRGEVPPDWLEADEWSASRWMADELGDAAARFIEVLPFSCVSQTAPELRLVHGTPQSANDGIGPWTSDRRTAEHWESVDENILICAHTHRPLMRSVAGGLVVNVGSVGLPFNADRRAQYALITTDAADVEVEFRQVPYDLDEILEVYRSSGFLDRGGVTAQLLMLELQHAEPFLVPFLHWASTLEIPPAEDQIDRFREVYDPAESLRSFLDRLQLTADNSSQS